MLTLSVQVYLSVRLSVVLTFTHHSSVFIVLTVVCSNSSQSAVDEHWLISSARHFIQIDGSTAHGVQIKVNIGDGPGTCMSWQEQLPQHIPLKFKSQAKKVTHPAASACSKANYSSVLLFGACTVGCSSCHKLESCSHLKYTLHHQNHLVGTLERACIQVKELPCLCILLVGVI